MDCVGKKLLLEASQKGFFNGDAAVVDALYPGAHFLGHFCGKLHQCGRRGKYHAYLLRVQYIHGLLYKMVKVAPVAHRIFFKFLRPPGVEVYGKRFHTTHAPRHVPDRLADYVWAAWSHPEPVASLREVSPLRHYPEPIYKHGVKLTEQIGGNLGPSRSTGGLTHDQSRLVLKNVPGYKVLHRVAPQVLFHHGAEFL